jgi:spore coat-associated protein N
VSRDPGAAPSRKDLDVSLLTNTRGRRLTLGIGVVALAVTGVTGLASAALFTDNDTVTGNSVATGTVDLGVAPASAAWGVGAVAPGWSDTYAIQVNNLGSLGLRYAVTSSSTNVDGKGLAGQLDAAVSTAGSVPACSGADFVTSPLYSGKLSGLVLGNPAAGQQSGDRAVSAASGEVLCVKLSMPKTVADNAFQGAETFTTLTFSSEQVVYNP